MRKPVAIAVAALFLAVPRSAVPQIGTAWTPEQMALLAIEDMRAPTNEQVMTLLSATRSSNVRTQVQAVRAIGRLERRDIIPELLPALSSATAAVRAEAANALAQTLKGDPLNADTGGRQTADVIAALMARADVERDPDTIASLARSLGRLPYVRPADVQATETFLSELLTKRPTEKENGVTTILVGAALGLESLARLSRPLASLDEQTIKRLRAVATSSLPKQMMPARTPAMQALVAARALDDETVASVIGDVTAPENAHRLATAELGGTGSAMDRQQRRELVAKAYADSEATVRYEAVRSWSRQLARTEGCGFLLQALQDPSLTVVLGAIDALGDRCKGDETVVNTLTAEARTPTPLSWWRESHALVALAKQNAERAHVALVSHVASEIWQARMYAARAATVMNDVEMLERLALDANDNVREVTLAPLRRLKKEDVEREFVAAFERNDYQLLRGAANELKGAAGRPAYVKAMLSALLRVTKEQKETSRDTRLALLDRLKEFGDESLASSLQPLLRDFDVKVAQSVADAITTWTGARPQIRPQPLAPQRAPAEVELKEMTEYDIEISFERGPPLRISLSPEEAPLTCTRIVRLVKAQYYDGLTIHRVVPNFVLQGGSPGANEYSGDGPFMRDEVGLLTNGTGTVGLSTRGRDTGDAQFYFNVIDNANLNHTYTVFGRVVGDLDEIREGDVMKRVRLVRKPMTNR